MLYIICCCSICSSWYIEVAIDYINVREDASSLSTRLTKVKKGQVYKVLDLVNKKKDKECFWYHIELKDNKQGYVCNPKGDSNRGKYLIDHNDPTDLYTPTITYKEDAKFNNKSWNVYEGKQNDGKNMINYVIKYNNDVYSITFISDKDIKNFVNLFMENVNYNQ